MSSKSLATREMPFKDRLKQLLVVFTQLHSIEINAVKVPQKALQHWFEQNLVGGFNLVQGLNHRKACGCAMAEGVGNVDVFGGAHISSQTGASVEQATGRLRRHLCPCSSVPGPRGPKPVPGSRS